jgi:hypothetical protein
MANDLDALMELEAELAFSQCGWRRILNRETGAFALVPKQALSESEWEQRSLEVHEAQEKIVLPELQKESPIAERKRRSDQGPNSELIRGNISYGKVNFEGD